MVLCPSHQSPNILLSELLSNLAKQQQRPLYIGFGSMEELGFFSSLDSVELIGIINEGELYSHREVGRGRSTVVLMQGVGLG
jgi:hypothetical protein